MQSESISNSTTQNTTGVNNNNSTVENSTTVENTNPQNNNTAQTAQTSNYNSNGDAFIMGVATRTAAKFAAHAKTPLTKTAAAGGAILLGAAGIMVKNISGNVSKDIGKSKILPNDISLVEILNKTLDLTGNSGLDLLLLLQLIQKIQLFFIILLIYNILFNLINLKTTEETLNKIFPLYIVNYLIKLIKYLKNSSKILIIVSLIAIVYSNYQSLFIVNLFIENLDQILNTYFKK